MALATPCFVSNKELSVDKVLELILKSEKAAASVVPPAKLRNGEVYLFSAAANISLKVVKCMCALNSHYLFIRLICHFVADL